jgi:two-component system, OmpR family, aerobic respiration control sensor histidine kinase ArcB
MSAPGPAEGAFAAELRQAFAALRDGLRAIAIEDLPQASRARIADLEAQAAAFSRDLEQALIQLPPANPRNALPVIQTKALLHSLKAQWTPALRDAGQSFQLLAAADLPDEIALDPVVITRILGNLLNNAISYAGAGRVTCRIGLLNATTLQIAVQDQGPGFDAETLHCIRSGQPIKGHPVRPGSGTGLRILRDMVEALEGTLEVQNRASGGAMVMVTLPLAGTPAPAPARLARLNLLIAEGSAAERQALRQSLTEMGASVTEVAKAVEVINQLEAQRFDLLLLATDLPRFSGLELLHHIRNLQGAAAGLPILVLTAQSDPAGLARLWAAGVEGIVAKPLALGPPLAEAVLRAIARALPQSPYRARPRAEIDPAQFANLLKMAGPEGAQEILRTFRIDLAKTERGLIAASHLTDWASLQAQSHVLIALAGTAGAQQLSDLAQTMNRLCHSADPDRSTLQTLLPQLLEALSALAQFIATQIDSEEDRP